MTTAKPGDSTMLTRQQQALHLHRRGWGRQRIAVELGIGLPAVSRLLQRAVAHEPATKIPRRPKPQRIRPLSLSHYV